MIDSKIASLHSVRPPSLCHGVRQDALRWSNISARSSRRAATQA